MSENIEPIRVPHVYIAISAVMEKLSKKGIAKDKDNKMQGYKFRGIDDVYNAMAPVLSEEKLMLLPRVKSRQCEERITQKGGIIFYVTLEVEFKLVCALDGSHEVVTVYGEAMDSGDKATNKAMSAAYKYACMEIFCIPTEGDNDADMTTHDNVRPISKIDKIKPVSLPDDDPIPDWWIPVQLTKRSEILSKFGATPIDRISDENLEKVMKEFQKLLPEASTEFGRKTCSDLIAKCSGEIMRRQGPPAAA